jgi:uncharacterized protein
MRETVMVGEQLARSSGWGPRAFDGPLPLPVSETKDNRLMLRNRWLHALSLAIVALLAASRVDAGEIRDRAGMFTKQAIKEAEAQLDRIEQRTRIPVVIETIDSLPGVEPGASFETRRDAMNALAEKRAREIGYEGVYLLISKNDRVFSNTLVKKKYEAMLPRSERNAIRDALMNAFKKGRYDEGLVGAVGILEQALTTSVPRLPGPGTAKVQVQPHGGADGAAAPGGYGVGTLLMIGLGIFGFLLLIRGLSGAFGRGGYSPTGMGGMPRPGMGPGPGGYGYGGPGYGGRGGGFFSGMLGGLGGAIAGNWLYDQFSGRHHESSHTDAGSYLPAERPEAYDPGGDDFVGGNDNGGASSWADPGDTGGGDWGGGDWGGGGGDWGGGDDGGGGW